MATNIVSLKELRLNMDKYARKVKAGASFTIVKQSKPIFKITPVDEEGAWEEVVNFTNIKKRGVSLIDVLKTLAVIRGGSDT